MDDPGRRKIITKRGTKYPERIKNSSKASILVMFAASGDGIILPPLTFYKKIYLYLQYKTVKMFFSVRTPKW